ncbi:MAG: thiamine pyrophosphate-binding protein [Rhodobacteraceae bacterium]|nr:thiamine pyrophosphate-binding protein [Paracoccaceae bacterium]
MTTEMTGGEAAVLSLHALGARTVYGLPGVQNDWLYNAFYDHREKFRIVHTRHEQGAAYMALGHALATGAPAVFNVVPGPGVLNASAALATAYGLNARVMCLAGQIPSKSIGQGRGVLHEIPDQLGVLRGLTKWARRAESPAAVPGTIGDGFGQMMSGRPRPVAVEVPMDVLAARAPVDLTAARFDAGEPELDDDAIEDAARLLGGAEFPMIFVGSGAQEASAAIGALAEMLQAPVVGYRTGMGVADARSPYSLHQPAARPLWDRADAVLAVGTNMRAAAGKWAGQHRPRIVRIDVDPESHRLFGAPDVAVTARAERALPALIDRLARHNRHREPARDRLLQAKADWAARVAVLEPQLSYLSVIRQELGEDGIFVDELTQVGFASRIAYPVYHPRTYISTGYQGTLGYGFPTALGVKVARPEVPVVSVTGDGGFMFGMPELATAVQHRIPLVVLVFNNNRYGNVQQMQINDYGGRVIATDLHNPDFVRLTESFGAQGLRATTPEALRQAMQRGFATTDVPTVIEIPFDHMPSVDQFR